MSNVLSQAGTTAVAETPRRTVIPRYEVRENGEVFTVTVFLPGVGRDAVATTLDDETLTVEGRRAWTAPEGWVPVYRESAEADYRLVLALDHRVNREAVRAELAQGVLTLTVPKAETVKPRQIEIKG